MSEHLKGAKIWLKQDRFDVSHPFPSLSEKAAERRNVYSTGESLVYIFRLKRNVEHFA